MSKSYIQPGEVATIKKGKSYFQIDSAAIKRIVWREARYLPVDEIVISEYNSIGYDEDGAYIVTRSE